MKKNLLSILILALLIVNIVLTAIMMVSVTSTNKKTAAVIGDIAKILNLELDKGSNEEEGEKTISIEDTAEYTIPDEMTILLKQGEDGKDHYALVAVTLAMDMKNEGYATYGETIGDKANLIKGEVVDAFSHYTVEQLQSDNDAVREDILDRLHALFGSDFIYKVTFTKMVPN